MPSLTNGKRKSQETLHSGILKKSKVSTPSIEPAQIKSNGNHPSAKLQSELDALAVQDEEECDAFYIVAGSYERIMIGLELSYSLDSPLNTESATDLNTEGLILKPIFNFPAHQSCLKSLTISPNVKGKKWLISSGTDETLKIWDLKRRREMGILNVASAEGGFFVYGNMAVIKCKSEQVSSPTPISSHLNSY